MGLLALAICDDHITMMVVGGGWGHMTVKVITCCQNADHSQPSDDRTRNYRRYVSTMWFKGISTPFPRNNKAQQITTLILSLSLSWKTHTNNPHMASYCLDLWCDDQFIKLRIKKLITTNELYKSRETNNAMG